MDNRVKQLLKEISVLEDELRTALSEQPSAMFFQIKGKRVEFEKSVKAAHRKLKIGFFQWLVRNRPQNLITGPIIYAMIVPLAIADVFISFYQYTCFPIYGIKKVRRGDYIIFDRQQLSYLNFIERFHCTYCAYGSGMIAYISEIVARTEQYFCPIKHAHKVLGSHARYAYFLDYGDAKDYQQRLEAFRTALAKES
jgi:hypothetical protein